MTASGTTTARVPDAFAPARLGPVTLRNRIVRAATHEGLARDGHVTDALVEFLRAPAAGGVGVVTLAYVVSSPEGRTYRDQIVATSPAVPGLRRLTEAVHREGAAAAMQLGHAGWFANPAESRAAAIGPSRLPNPHTLRPTRRAGPADLARIRDDFGRAARVATTAGFDVVEVHLGHGYLLSQFLSPFTNRRRDAWGGDLEGRARFPREVLEAVRLGVGPQVAVTAKLNMTDGFRGGLEVDEARELVRWLAADGTVDAIQLTGGFTARTPMFLLRGDPLLPGLAKREPDPRRRVALRVGARVLRERAPFREAYLRPLARRFLGLGVPLTLLGGITRRTTIDEAMAEGFDFVAMARALLHDPDLVARMRDDETASSGCVPCNGCVLAMEAGDGAQCVRRPPGRRPGIGVAGVGRAVTEEFTGSRPSPGR